MTDFEGVEDGVDDIANVSNRQTPDEAFEASGGQLPRDNTNGPGSPVNGPPLRKLADQRSSDHLDPNEARDVIRLAKAGDPEAKERLFKCFHKALIKVAGEPKYDGPPFDERLSAAEVGFWKALAGFDQTRNNGFWAYARKFVEGAVADCVTDWHYRGLKDQSIAARKERAGHRPIIVEYNGVEGSNYDLEGREPIIESITGRIGAE